MKKKVMVVYGTRPEAIKVAPLIKALADSKTLIPVLVSTGQHREMLDQVNRWFGLEPDVDLDVLKPGQSLTDLAARIMKRLPEVVDTHDPDAVVVQGDTTTVALGAIACFYKGIPVVHLEAGLRSGSIYSPFPEEANRRLAGQVAALHLAPTRMARDNLLAEGIDPSIVSVVGNTVIDALDWTVRKSVQFSDERLRLASSKRQEMVLLTAHRRENWGEPMADIAEAIAELAERYPSLLFVFPAHKNPTVRGVIFPIIQDLPNVIIVEPLSYSEFVHAQRWAKLILTDSGGVQEEAPSFGKPVLVLRENTERPEAVIAGTVKLIGTERKRIVEEASLLLDSAEAYSAMSNAVNPYGDGHAAQRSVAAIAHLLGVGERLPEYGG